MPYGSRAVAKVAKRKYPYKKTSTKATFPTRILPIGMRAAQWNRGITGTEVKFNDVTIQNTTTAFAAGADGFQITLLNGIATGTSDSTRIGRKIVNTKIFWKGAMALEASATAKPTVYVRLLIIYDRQTNGTTPVSGDMFAGTSATAFSNLNNSDRFLVLKEHHAAIASVGSASAGAGPGSGSPTVADFYLAWNGKLETVYGGTAATIASIATGSIWGVMLVSEICEDAIANGEFCINSTTRLRYTDA